MLERFFPAFLEFYFPVAHAGIDWMQGYTFLDKELQKVVRDARLRRRWADALVRVTGRDGIEDWVLVHVEVQGENRTDFAQRMFVYNDRLYDRYAKPVVSLAVLGEPWVGNYGHFGYERSPPAEGWRRGWRKGISRGQAALLGRQLTRWFGLLPE